MVDRVFFFPSLVGGWRGGGQGSGLLRLFLDSE